MKGPQIGPGEEDIPWSNEVAPRGRGTSSIGETNTSNLEPGSQTHPTNPPSSERDSPGCTQHTYPGVVSIRDARKPTGGRGHQGHPIHLTSVDSDPALQQATKLHNLVGIPRPRHSHPRNWPPPLDPPPSRNSSSHPIRGPTNFDPEVSGRNQSGATGKRLGKIPAPKPLHAPLKLDVQRKYLTQRACSPLHRPARHHSQGERGKDNPDPPSAPHLPQTSPTCLPASWGFPHKAIILHVAAANMDLADFIIGSLDVRGAFSNIPWLLLEAVWKRLGLPFYNLSSASTQSAPGRTSAPSYSRAAVSPREKQNRPSCTPSQICHWPSLSSSTTPAYDPNPSSPPWWPSQKSHTNATHQTTSQQSPSKPKTYWK